MMAIPKYAARRDKNEPQIIHQLSMIPGLTIVQLSQKNIPDLLIGYQGVNYLVEIKTPKGKTKAGQENFLATWQGQAQLCRSIDEILTVIGVQS